MVGLVTASIRGRVFFGVDVIAKSQHLDGIIRDDLACTEAVLGGRGEKGQAPS